MSTFPYSVPPKRKAGAFTLTELMIATGLVSLVGLAFIVGSNFMLRSFAHTMAINFSHLEARNGVQQMLYTIHNSVSTTQLVSVTSDAGGVRRVVPVASGVLSSQALAVQTLTGGPFPVAVSASSGASVISVLINSNQGFTPAANQLILVPTHGVEKFVQSVGSYADSKYPVTIRDSDGLSTLEAISIAPFTGTTPTENVVLAYFTRPTVFLAENGELRQYDVTYATGSTTPQLVGPGRLITTGLSKVDPKNAALPFQPFSTPLNASGAGDATQVAAIDISADDPKVSNLGFAATNMFINSKIPTRHQVASRPTIRPAISENN